MGTERRRRRRLALGALAASSLATAATAPAARSGLQAPMARGPVCLFGDSISSGLAGSLGAGVSNYAVGGLHTASLIRQLQGLAARPVRCPTAIIAIGTNDAMLPISDQQFQANLSRILALVRGLGAERIHLLPAFYSTVAASQRPTMAGPIWRVEQINGLIAAVGGQEKVPVQAAVIQPLFEGAALRLSYTQDGVHLNQAGKAVYRSGLLGLLQKPNEIQSAGPAAQAGVGP